jgi:hypothetical protein
MPLVAIATRRTESSQLLWAAILILVAILTAFYLPTRPLFVFGFVVCIVVCVFAVAVMRRGLDELKHLNDTEWHDVADATIRDVATHWRDDLREGDVLARVGGDAPYPCSQRWPRWRDDESLDEAIERADALMYAEKSERKGGRSGQDYGQAAPRPATHYQPSLRRRHSRRRFANRIDRKS